jgi:hypothetical protein
MADVSLLRQQQRNAESREAWERYTSHRQRVMEILIQAHDPNAGPSSIFVWGAGNCNDLDLRQLAERFETVCLADLDAAALDFGVRQQGMFANDRLQLLDGIDATGIGKTLSGWTPQSPPSGEEVAACVREANSKSVPELPAPFDVVASLGLLTQLIESVALAVGEHHSGFPDLMVAVRNRHLRQLVETLRPGGRFVLVTDVVSSTTVPGLSQVPPSRLSAVLSQLIQQRNFFTGANPFALCRFFTADASVSGCLEQVELAAPWLWDFGSRTYAVCALTGRRKARDSGFQ